MTHSYIVVGAGIAGGLLAHTLIKQGASSVILLEAGQPTKMRDHASWISFVTTGKTPYDNFGDNDNDAENYGNTDLILSSSRLFTVGGSTLHWGGWCPRMHTEDFSRKSLTGRAADWPIDYATLEPWYCRAESILGVSGDVSRERTYRSAPFPFPRIEPTSIDRLMTRACESLDWSHSQLPIARNILPREGHIQCQTFGTCKYCPIGGRYTGDMAVDSALNTSKVTLIHQAVTLRILMRTKSAAAGVEYLKTDTNKKHFIEADRIIIASGAIETPKLLLNSLVKDTGRALGNHSGHLGRNLSAHPMLKFNFMFSRNGERLAQELDFPTWCTRHFDTPSNQETGKFVITILKHPHIDVAELIGNGISRENILSQSSGQAPMILGALFEMESQEESRIDIAPGFSKFGLPRTKIFFNWSERSIQAANNIENTLRDLAKAIDCNNGKFKIDQTKGSRYAVRADHAIGTCRMSESPSDGVVSKDLLIHDVENVWICSNAVFPTAGAANPTLTLNALSLRLANALEPSHTPVRHTD